MHDHRSVNQKKTPTEYQGRVPLHYAGIKIGINFILNAGVIQLKVLTTLPILSS